jgi:hypothetical protein
MIAKTYRTEKVSSICISFKDLYVFEARNVRAKCERSCHFSVVGSLRPISSSSSREWRTKLIKFLDDEFVKAIPERVAQLI